MSDPRNSVILLGQDRQPFRVRGEACRGIWRRCGSCARLRRALDGRRRPDLTRPSGRGRRLSPARKLQQFYGSDYYVTDSYSAGPSTRVYRDIPGGNNEIRELQRLFPETNWPPSLPERPLGFSTIQSALSIAGLKLLGEVV
jgi:hypothetical protein